MNKISFYKITGSLLLMSMLLFSCDKDFNELGSGIVDEDHFEFKPDTTSTVIAFNQAIGAVQSNTIANASTDFAPVNSLGVYTNPVFGKVKANYVVQLEMKSVNPTFEAEKNPVLDSVVLSIPYFSTRKTGSGNEVTYDLDSIKGSGTVNLKVYESGYFLNNLNPDDNFQTQQAYYTDQDPTFNAAKKGNPLNNSTDAAQNTQFEPSNKQIIELKLDRGLNPVEPKVVSKRNTPRMRLKLDKAFFQQKIMNAPAGKLVNNNIFKEYFKGLYFQVEEGTEDLLMQLDFSKGDVTLHYREYASVKDGVVDTYKDSDNDNYGGTPKLTAKTVVLNMTGNYVSLLQTENSNVYANGISNPNRNQGDSKLYLKGGEGSIAVIDLFGPDNFGPDGKTGSPDGVADELNIIRNNGWLINEANLTFYIDRDAMGNAVEPQRIYLFDLKNNKPLADWSTDYSASSSVKYSKQVHDGIIQKEEGRGVKYRVRITNHIRNLIRKDSTNVRLGLAVTESVKMYENVKVKAPVTIPGVFPQSPTFKIDRIPASSLFNPLGTILYGNNIAPGTADYRKRLKLEIYYTKPN